MYVDAGGVWKGTVEKRSWTGNHLIRLKCTLGNTANMATQSRGNRGLFNSVYSLPVKLVIKNPCEKTQVNSVQVPKLAVPVD